jgi:hypothetical protein
MKKFALMALVLAVAVSAAHATTTDPTYNLTFTTSGSNWYLWAQQASVTLPNAGISSFLIDVIGTGGTQVVTASNRAPVGDVAVYDPDQDITTHNPNGFWYNKGNGTITAGNAIGLTAGQGTVYSGANDPFKDSLIVQGFGQTAGTIVGGAAYTVPLKLAQGTFSGPGTFTFNASGNALNTGWVGPGNVTPVLFIPEPATVGLLVLGGLAMLRRRRA